MPSTCVAYHSRTTREECLRAACLLPSYRQPIWTLWTQISQEAWTTSSFLWASRPLKSSAISTRLRTKPKLVTILGLLTNPPLSLTRTAPSSRLVAKELSKSSSTTQLVSLQASMEVKVWTLDKFLIIWAPTCLQPPWMMALSRWTTLWIRWTNTIGAPCWWCRTCTITTSTALTPASCLRCREDGTVVFLVMGLQIPMHR